MATETIPSLPDETFQSGVDLWLIVVIVVAVGAPIVFVAAPPPAAHDIWLARLIVLGTTVFIAVILATFLRGTDYTLRRDDLYVRGGPLKWSVPYRAIHAVEWTHTLISAPAPSLKRLRIRYGTYAWVVISPRDRNAFVAALQRRVPNLEVRR
jgi:hypothetical protein